MGAIATPRSPNKRIPTSVAIEAAMKLTRLFPRRMRPIRRSGLESRFSEIIALRIPSFAR